MQLFPTQLPRFLVKHAPRFFQLPVRIIPERIQTHLIEQALNGVFNQQIVDGEFEFLTDRWLHIEVIDVGLHFYTSADGQKLSVVSDFAKPDLRFAGNLNDLVLLLGRLEDPDTLFFQRRLIIEGNAEMGLELKNLLDGIDFDEWPLWRRKLISELAQMVALHSAH